MDAITKTSKSGGCGCGGGGKSGGCGCGGSSFPAVACACGDVGCTTCRNQGFTRPQFFAGQLLTEEDLQKLVDFVVAKQRLHNQRLWGDGVVCGLEVTCHPCGGGTVQVNPGYALDCCGNDLVLSCPQSLDINAMIRDLKRSLRGGHDCGDPCPPPKKNGQSTPAEPAGSGSSSFTSTSAAGATAAAATPRPTESPVVSVHEPKDTTRHYCLYIRYCETFTEPVTPYATDEGCSNQSCQPTRVNEGVRFELRCQESCGHEPDIRDRICECIGDLDSAFQTTQHSNTLYFVTQMAMPVANVTLTDESEARKNFVAAVTDMQKNRVPIAAAAKIEAARPGAEQPKSELGEASARGALSVDEFERWLIDIHSADAHLAAFQLAQKATSETREVVLIEAVGEDDVLSARSRLIDAATELKAHVNDVPAPELARKFYVAALDRTLELTTGQPPLTEPRLREIANGRLFLAADYEIARPAVLAMREELLDRLDLSPRTGDCHLRFDVESIRIPGPNASTEEWDRTAAQLTDAWLRYLKDCLCAALNPPCASCDDPAVLLACLVVKDCEVVEICNLKRKFVLSGPALRYWLPPLNWLGEVLEKLCCPDPICEEKEEQREFRPSQTLNISRAFGVGRKLSGRVNFGIFQFLCRSRKFRPSLDLSRRFRTSVITPREFAPQRPLQDTIRDVGSEIFRRIGMPELTVSRPPDIEGRISEFAAALQNEEIRKFAAEMLEVDPARARETMTEMAEERVAEAVEKLTTDAAKDLKEARAVKKKNTELSRQVEELTKQITELRNQMTRLQEGRNG